MKHKKLNNVDLCLKNFVLVCMLSSDVEIAKKPVLNLETMISCSLLCFRLPTLKIICSSRSLKYNLMVSRFKTGGLFGHFDITNVKFYRNSIGNKLRQQLSSDSESCLSIWSYLSLRAVSECFSSEYVDCRYISEYKDIHYWFSDFQTLKLVILANFLKRKH